MTKTIPQSSSSFQFEIFNVLSDCRQIRSVVALGLMLLLSINNTAWANKINAAYINTQPVPLGDLKLSTAQTYGATVFTRFNIMGLTFCSNDGCTSSDKANPIYWGSKQALAADWTVPSGNKPALAVLKALNPNNNKKLFASIIGTQSSDYLGGLSTKSITPNATVCGAGGTGVGNINCAVFYLDNFMTAYGIDGLDIDLETGSATGFTNLLAGIAAGSTFLKKYALSFAPFADGSTYSAVYVQGGACAFQDNGITNYIAGRQYYSGGAIGYPPTSVDAVVTTLTSELKQADTTTCNTSGKLKLDAGNMVMGLSPYSVLGDQFPHIRGFPNTCQYYYQRSNPDCAEMMKRVIAKYPNIGGAFVWTSGLIDPTYYACYMGNALNGTNNNCGEPLPIPGNAGYCGPTQPPNCKHPNSIDVNAGPIWSNQDAKTKCPATCANVNLKWNGQWTTTVPGQMSVCGCVPK
jgi:hypothetical protein